MSVSYTFISYSAALCSVEDEEKDKKKLNPILLPEMVIKLIWCQGSRRDCALYCPSAALPRHPMPPRRKLCCRRHGNADKENCVDQVPAGAISTSDTSLDRWCADDGFSDWTPAQYSFKLGCSVPSVKCNVCVLCLVIIIIIIIAKLTLCV